MAQNSSRLHRLLTLLDTGSTQATRFAAARQIGDIAKLHPQDLNSLLKKVSQYLRSRNWDTRVAAAHAVGAIAENVKHISLKELFTRIESEAAISDVSNDMGMIWSNFHPNIVASLSFDSFNINKVLEFGSPLLASGGQEYDVASDSSKNPAERLARQKQNLRRRLGLDVCEQFIDVNDMIKDEDLLTQRGYLSGNGSTNVIYASRPGQNIQQLVATMVPSFRPKRLSARELNLLKRKAKINSKDNIKCFSEDDESEVPYSQNSAIPKRNSSDPQGPHLDYTDAVGDEEYSEHVGSGRWPFQHIVEQLIHDIFDPMWEVRHGALMALREILTHQGACAGLFESNESSSIDSHGKDYLGSTKRTRQIDLNVQSAVEQCEPGSKRQRVKEIDHNSTINKDGDMWNTKSALVNDDIGGVHVKLETEKGGCLGQHELVGTTLPTSVSEDSSSVSLVKVPKDLSECSELMDLIKVARHSWVKNWEFLQDCAIRFLCILSLDRFGDYVSDQVVAPVRETCAQALGAVLKFMHPSLVFETLKILLQMQSRQEWEIRHGCLLGIKYLVAVRLEMLQNLLPYILPACKSGLEDPDDDVRAIAAEALIPTAAAIVSLDNPTLQSIMVLLWDILLDLDDLSPSTSSVMNLLAEIYSQPEMVPKMLGTLTLVDRQGFDLNEVSEAEDYGDGMKCVEKNLYFLSTLTPRLWPFMRHSITAVRRSAIRTLERLIEVGYRRSSEFWPTSVFCDALRIVFQNLLLESNDEILQSSERVWNLLLQCPEQDLEAAAREYFASWLQLVGTPYGSPLDATKMFWPIMISRKSHVKAAAKFKTVKLENEQIENVNIYDTVRENISHDKNFDAPTNSTKIIVGADSEKSVTSTRVVSATALGVFASKLPEHSIRITIDPLWKDLLSLSGVQRQVSSLVLIAWFKELRSRAHHGTAGNLLDHIHHLRQWLLDLLVCSDPSFPTKDSLLPYVELSRTYAKMRNEANLMFLSADASNEFKSLVSSVNINLGSVSVEDAISFASKISLTIESTGSSNKEKSLLDKVETSKQQLLSTAGYLKCIQNNLHVTVSAMLAAAVVWMSDLPAKLNPVILPLMASIKREQEAVLQQKAAEALAELIFHCIERKPGPNDKLIKNICSLTCTDSCETPQAALINSMEIIEDQNLLCFGKAMTIQKAKVQTPSAGEDRSKIEGFISRRGSELALKYLCEKFGSSLFDKLPKMWDCLTEVLNPINDDRKIVQITDIYNDKDPQALINNIQVVRSIAPMSDVTLKPKILTLLPRILGCVRHWHVAVRLAASRCVTSMAKSMTTTVMGAVIENVIPMLADYSSVPARQGAGMLVSLLVQGLGVDLVPYASLLVVPLLRCMSDCDHAVRQSVTHSFAALVPLLPLARGISPPIGINGSLSTNTEDDKFLEQLLDNSHIDDYKIPIDIKVSLRRYQQEGINWLSFLRRFKLHGILCDDMGLGKTLQASVIVASDISERRTCSDDKDPLSLIICPSTLVGHWAYEIEKYIDNSVMIILQYVGSSQERLLLRGQFDRCNVIITSYDIIRKDIDHLSKLAWNYCILDEGHIIKNSKSKITGAVKQLRAQHRLLLSGTPIQNNVLELWSLFDFLMPGFLGTERQFQSIYGKPLLSAKDSKCSAKDAEAGALAMEALHKQVMPFLLRRTKDEVLSDLPEKIIQDRYCDLSPLQLKLYEQFSCSDAKKEISTLVQKHDVMSTAEETSRRTTSHIFQSLQYLLKLCSHPLLVVGEKAPDSVMCIVSEVIPSCTDILTELHQLHYSPKLIALQEILEECGVGLDATCSEGDISVGQHRVLIFAQHKAFLDIIERDLFRAHMKSVTYLRLDGSVGPEKRFEVVQTFNSDPTIDVLLLTTHVGGLGLNLTSADTIVFMEHDWNPMKDLQAMDRAHRLGQRKVVNVHRLIMRGTLEEKVMSLQKFKVSVANAVINAENASLKTMNTDQLLDLFANAQTTRKVPGPQISSNGTVDGSQELSVGGKGLKGILNGLEELWDQSQYEDEYNLNQFLTKLNGGV